VTKILLPAGERVLDKLSGTLADTEGDSDVVIELENVVLAVTVVDEDREAVAVPEQVIEDVAVAVRETVADDESEMVGVTEADSEIEDVSLSVGVTDGEGDGETNEMS
jgi:hypothetical protein